MRRGFRVLAIVSMLGTSVAISTVAAQAGGFNFNAHLFQGCFAGGTTKCSPNQGEAEAVNDSTEQGVLLTSVGSLQHNTFGFAGVKFDVPASKFTFNDLTTLQSDYELSFGNCGGGSPRWQIAVRTPSGAVDNIQVYVGPAASANGDSCSPAQATEVNTGNYIGSGSCGDLSPRYDDSQLGGSPTSDYSMTKSSYGTDEVVGLSFVVDAGWSQPQNEQQVFMDKLQVGGTVNGITGTTTNFPETSGVDSDSPPAGTPSCN